MLVEYFERMSTPKPFTIRAGDELEAHQVDLREKLLKSINLYPTPERVPLNLRVSDALNHPWCTVRHVCYQLWPEIYSDGFLYLPKRFAEEPAPGMLCPHGHWAHGAADAAVQTRCLVFAKKGYVVFSSRQHHFEDLQIGVSHQTVMVWNNMRALDFLCSLDEVDDARIGCCGCSGGGLQTEMLAALDERVNAATIVGMTCDFREILFPHKAHCACNHFPDVMQYTDHPEISTLRAPRPIQYLTMDDWTATFEQTNFPTIRELYAAGEATDKTECTYWETPHSYDTPKRERTYWWMDRWLTDTAVSSPEGEPAEVAVFRKEQFYQLQVEVDGDRGISSVGAHLRHVQGYRTPALKTRREWQHYRREMTAILRELLGEKARLRRRTRKPERLTTEEWHELEVERVLYPSEGSLRVSAVLLRSIEEQGRRPVVVICDAAGKEATLQRAGADSPAVLARNGALVALVDVRFSGALSLAELSGGVLQDSLRFKAVSMPAASEKTRLSSVWFRNSILWGRPLPAMACTDIRAVLDGLSTRRDVDIENVRIVSRGSFLLAAAALFAAILDRRFGFVDLDLLHSCFAKVEKEGGDSNQDEPVVVPFILQHGDILQWAALAADRQLTLRHLPQEAGSIDWMQSVFSVLNNPDGLSVPP